MAKYITVKTIHKENKLANWAWFFAILVVLYIIFYSVFNFVPYFKNRQHFVVVTNSMSPVINIGDLAIVNKVYDSSDLSVDTIIAFYQDLNNNGTDEIIIHYIADIIIDGANTTYKTRRQNATSYVNWDAWDLTEEEIIGIFEYRIKRLGSLIMFAESPFGKFIIIMDIVVIFAVIEYFKKDAELQKKKQLKEERYKKNL